MNIDIEHIKNVAETIRQQLFALTPVNVIMSWGLSGMVATTHNNMPSLRLMVSGRLHKGAVIVSLDEASDYYNLYLMNKEEVRKVADDLDFTQFSDFIDGTIEGGKNEALLPHRCIKDHPETRINKILKWRNDTIAVLQKLLKMDSSVSIE